MRQNTKILLITIAAWLMALAFGCLPAEAQSFAYVTNILSNDVSVINTANNTVVVTVNVGLGPTGVAITPNGAFAYVTNFSSDNVSVINTANNTVVTTVSVGTDPLGWPSLRLRAARTMGKTSKETVTSEVTTGMKPKRPCKGTGEMDFEKEHRYH